MVIKEDQKRISFWQVLKHESKNQHFFPQKNPTKEIQYDFRERAASRASSGSNENNPESSVHGLIIQAKKDGRFVCPRNRLLLDQLGNQFLQELSWTMPGFLN